ncbi:MotB family protein [Gynuella sunshinyii]|nr:MotB family protein [Gynuella sunshinyii]
MSDDTEDDCPPCAPGLPGWLATFADLMSLLMCFFVLLLSFSEMDALKFKRLAGSMRNAFGVQNQIDVNAIPKGTSIIAQEFSPGKPEPTPINQIRQQTIDDLRDSLEVLCQDEMQQQQTAQGTSGKQSRDIAVKQEAEAEAREDARVLAKALEKQIEDGKLQIETIKETIVIRISEQSFGPGSDYVADEFLPILDMIRELLINIRGDIYVEGHTDSAPMVGGRFRNNFQLSAARALAVAEYLFEAPEMDTQRFTIVGHGSTRPLTDQTTPAAMAQNRRVEILIKKINDEYQDEIIPPEEQGDNADFSDPSLFGLSPEDIF